MASFILDEQLLSFQKLFQEMKEDHLSYNQKADSSGSHMFYFTVNGPENRKE